MILFIYGPRGCGKTRNKDRFLTHYKKEGYRNIWEEWEYFDDKTKMLSHAIILCNERPDDVLLDAWNAKAISFENAMLESK